MRTIFKDLKAAGGKMVYGELITLMLLNVTATHLQTLMTILAQQDLSAMGWCDVVAKLTVKDKLKSQKHQEAKSGLYAGDASRANGARKGRQPEVRQQGNTPVLQLRQGWASRCRLSISQEGVGEEGVRKQGRAPVF